MNETMLVADILKNEHKLNLKPTILEDGKILIGTIQIGSKISTIKNDDGTIIVVSNPVFNNLYLSKEYDELFLEDAEKELKLSSSITHYEARCKNCRHEAFLNKESCPLRKEYDKLCSKINYRPFAKVGEHGLYPGYTKTAELHREAKININHGINCKEFECAYITYPFEIDSYYTKESALSLEIKKDNTTQLVKIRPCGDKYKNKTFLGVLLSERFPIAEAISYIKKTEIKTLNFSMHTNPAIYIPELNEIVFGYESFWGRTDSKDDISEISDDTINNLWYIKFLKGK